MSKMGGGLPPMRDDKQLEPLIQACLSPLPIARAVVRQAPKVKENFKGTKAVGKNENLNQVFKDEPVIELGLQS